MNLRRPTGRTASEDIKHKLTLEEEVAKIEEMGQESESKAAKVVIEEGKEQEKKDKKIEAEQLDTLETKSRFKFVNYKQYLAHLVAEIMRVEEICPKGWLWDAWANESGVGLTLLSPQRRKFVRAFKPVNEPKFDRFACTELVFSAENTIKKVNEEAKQKTGNGHIITP